MSACSLLSTGALIVYSGRVLERLERLVVQVPVYFCHLAGEPFHSLVLYGNSLWRFPFVGMLWKSSWLVKIVLLVDMQYRVALEWHFLLIYGPVSGVKGSIRWFRFRFGYSRLVSRHALFLLLNLALLECFLVLPLLLFHSNHHILLILLKKLSFRFRGFVESALWWSSFLSLYERWLIIYAFIDLL